MTGLGAVEGVTRDGVRHFLGVPFAAPPVGDLRFAAPAPATPWSGTLSADEFGPAPIQRSDPLSVKLGLTASHPQSEDCLYLNVFSPAEPSREPRAVMVWIHGGAFSTGTAAAPVYDGSRLARDGDVVVVTLNYRVGALGFLDVGVANLGLRDQVAALGFVQREIAAFGGDPERVTLFGESAGAGSIAALLAAPPAQGLFQRAIVQSAAPEGVLSADEAARRADLFADQAGVPTGSREARLDAVRRLSSEALVAAEAGCAEPGPRRIGMFFAPVVDGSFLPRMPLEAIARGAARDVALIIGTTAEEMQLYHLAGAFGALPAAKIPAAIASGLPGAREAALARAETLMRFYEGPELRDEDRYFATVTDSNLFVPSAELAASHARHQPSTFMYRFAWPSPMEGGKLGACHALDIPYALGTLDCVSDFAGVSEEARRVSSDMRSAWVAFAKTGDPSSASVGAWPPYEALERWTLWVDDPCRPVRDPDSEKRQAWDQVRSGA